VGRGAVTASRREDVMAAPDRTAITVRLEPLVAPGGG